MTAGALPKTSAEPLNCFKRFVLAAGFAIVGCSNDDRPTVVVYTSVDEHIAREVIGGFEQQHNIRVMMVGDTEVKKTAGLAERLLAEKDRPRADVYWSSEAFMTAELARQGVFEQFEPQGLPDWPPQFRDRDGKWYGFGARARVIVYAPDRVAESDVPHSWMDLTHERFRGRIVMADPRFGTTGGHLGAMKTYWKQAGSSDQFNLFIRGLAANQVRLLPSGNAGVVEAVACGEADIGMTDTDDVWAAQARDLNVELVYPTHDAERTSGAGTLLIPNTVALVKGAPHLEQARMFAEYLLSKKVERMLANSVSHNIPIRPGLAAEFPQFEVPNPLVVEISEAGQQRTEAVAALMDALAHGAASNEAGAE